MHISHIPLREYVTWEHYSQPYVYRYMYKLYRQQVTLTLEYTHYTVTAARYVQQTGDIKRKILTQASNTLPHIINVQVIFKGENPLFDVLVYTNILQENKNSYNLN